MTHRRIIDMEFRAKWAGERGVLPPRTDYGWLAGAWGGDDSLEGYLGISWGRRAPKRRPT
jgi:hypothetical protein